MSSRARPWRAGVWGEPLAHGSSSWQGLGAGGPGGFQNSPGSRNWMEHPVTKKGHGYRKELGVLLEKEKKKTTSQSIIKYRPDHP